MWIHALSLLKCNGSDLIYLVRHVAGDGGDVDEHDRRENELQLRTEHRRAFSESATGFVVRR